MYVRTVWADGLDPEQLAVADHGDGPLVVVAGAGTGKTRALTGRVGALIERGVPPERILLLTFTRRAADDMLGRATALAPAGSRPPWGGTFHAVAARLLSAHAGVLGLTGLSVLDPSDAATLMEVLLDEHALSDRTERTPRPATLVDAYSRAVNTRRPVRDVLDEHFPWCSPHADAVSAVLRDYVARKRARGLLDFDDLLLGWAALLADERLGAAVRGLWDHVLVDEYQDVNQLQVDIVRALRPDGRGLTVVGDDAQAIYGFRGCDPGHLDDLVSEHPDATVVRLERSYRSRPPLVDVANLARPDGGRLDVVLRPVRDGGARPVVVRCHDAAEEARSVADRVLAAQRDGVRLRDQAVLMRTGHHSDLLELELGARRVPYQKYGGLRFLEAAHVKDLLAALRLVSNPDDELAWFRILRLHKGIGPASARALTATLLEGGTTGGWDSVAAQAPAVARVRLHETLATLAQARDEPTPHAQATTALRLLRPLLEARYSDAAVRLGDLQRLVDASSVADDLPTFAAELALDPPRSTGAHAGPPHLDEDYLVLSTVHSAKGLEWERVHVIGLVDGAFPSDMALRGRDGLAEEQRLFYVAVTRARDELTLHVPLRMPHRRRALDDRHSVAPASRFIDRVAAACDTEERVPARAVAGTAAGQGPARVALPDLDELFS